MEQTLRCARCGRHMNTRVVGTMVLVDICDCARIVEDMWRKNMLCEPLVLTAERGWMKADGFGGKDGTAT